MANRTNDEIIVCSNGKVFVYANKGAADNALPRIKKSDPECYRLSGNEAVQKMASTIKTDTHYV